MGVLAWMTWPRGPILEALAWKPWPGVLEAVSIRGRGLEALAQPGGPVLGALEEGGQ